jgi:imidazolonepropionase-like amidohydrolase
MRRHPRACARGIARGVIPGPRIIGRRQARSASTAATATPTVCRDQHGADPAARRLLGADDCARAVRERVRDGADIIKITATGGVLSNTAAGLAQQFTDAELAAIVQAAHAMGRKVTAHAHGVGRHQLVPAPAAIRSSTAPTRTMSRQAVQGQRRLSHPHPARRRLRCARSGSPDTFLQPAQKAKAREPARRCIDMLRRMHAAGVKIAFGTDTGVSAHGDNAQEFALMVEGWHDAASIDPGGHRRGLTISA